MLRKKRLVTAAALASELEVHVRTVYRDVRDLARSGVPVAGEAGVGYALTGGYELPPLMFTEDEVEALTLGARVVMAWGDGELEGAAVRALAKIEAVLPPRLHGSLEKTPLHAPSFHVSPRLRTTLELLRRAIREGLKVELGYVDKSGAPTTRTTVPVGLFFWGTTWSLAAWCELRQAYRSFRLDRMGECTLGGRVPPEEARTLDAFLASWGPPAETDPKSLRSQSKGRTERHGLRSTALRGVTPREGPRPSSQGTPQRTSSQRITSGKGGPGRAKK